MFELNSTVTALQVDRRSQWCKLTTGPLWSRFQALTPPLPPDLIEKTKRQFLQSSLDTRKLNQSQSSYSFVVLRHQLTPYCGFQCPAPNGADVSDGALVGCQAILASVPSTLLNILQNTTLFPASQYTTVSCF